MKHGLRLLLAGIVGVLCACIQVPQTIFTASLGLGIFFAFALKDNPSSERLAWGVGLCVVASVSATMFSRLFFLVGFFWFPWFMLFVVPFVTVNWLKLATLWRLGFALTLPAFLYLGSALLLFHFWGGQPSPYTETRDSQQREPVVGPAVSWLTYVISPPHGPCCVLSCDYDGSEWVWKVYKPLVDRWFATPGCRYYDPDKPPTKP